MTIGPLTIPAELWPIIIGLVLVGVGLWWVSSGSLLAQLAGLVLTLGGVYTLLAVPPAEYLPSGRFILVAYVLIFCALSWRIMASADWKKGKVSGLTGAGLLTFGLIALYVLVAPDTSFVRDLFVNGFTDGLRVISQIFGLTSQAL